MPWPLVFKLCGVFGLVIITASVFIKPEVKRDWLHLLGTVFLLIYSLFLQDLIFILVQALFIILTGYQIKRLRGAQAL
jgi:Ca2+/Na+ antiporter